MSTTQKPGAPRRGGRRPCPHPTAGGGRGSRAQFWCARRSRRQREGGREGAHGGGSVSLGATTDSAWVPLHAPACAGWAPRRARRHVGAARSRRRSRPSSTRCRARSRGSTPARRRRSRDSRTAARRHLRPGSAGPSRSRRRTPRGLPARHVVRASRRSVRADGHGRQRRAPDRHQMQPIRAVSQTAIAFHFGRRRPCLLVR